MNARALLGTLLTVSISALGASCGGDDSSGGGNAGAPDGGAQTDASATLVVQRGRIVDFGKNSAVAGATVTAGMRTAQTGADGRYSISVEKDAPFAMSVTATGYLKLIEETTSLVADTDRGDTLLPSMNDANLLKLALDQYDPGRGVLSVQLLPIGTCAHVAGAKVSVAMEGARVAYFSNRLPLPQNTEALDAQLPTAVIYNLPPGQKVTVTVTHPTCKLAAFPVEYQGITYRGDVTTEAGDVTSFARLFLEGPVATGP